MKIKHTLFVPDLINILLLDIKPYHKSQENEENNFVDYLEIP